MPSQPSPFPSSASQPSVEAKYRTDGDLESGDATEYTGLYNDAIDAFTWDDLRMTLPASGKKPEKVLLGGISGEARAGQLVAIMGPSGSGKTMLLNRLAHRSMPPKATATGDIHINDVSATISSIMETSSYVEQQDHLIGSITTSETLAFAAKLGLADDISKTERDHRVKSLLNSFGLMDQANMIIGTPIQKGLSGGQKRRVSIASQLITSPKILFLDEPTSGLDSVASFEVISYLQVMARKNNLIIIASIHQPSTKTFNLFDSVYLLSKGRLAYGGALADINTYFAAQGLHLPPQMNPAEWILELVDTDFSKDHEGAMARLKAITDVCAANQAKSQRTRTTKSGIPHVKSSRRSQAMTPFTLLHRAFIKSYRDVIPYWIRVLMYTCLALLMGTVWLRLGTGQEYISPRTTSLFFSGAFLSFMAVAYIPAYIEDQATFFKERANGLYGPLSFLVANFLIGMPYLFLITMIFSVICYWLSNFWPTATGFFTFVGFLFLDLVAAESLVVLIASIVPNFIISLTLVAFANGLWMCVNGFMVPLTILNVFWRSWVTKIDYQAWTFQAMMWNEFHDRDYYCAGEGNCMFTPGPDGVTIPGKSVLEYYGYNDGRLGAFAGYIIAIIVVYRVLAYVALTFRRQG